MENNNKQHQDTAVIEITNSDAWLASVGFAMRLYPRADMRELLEVVKNEAELMRKGGWISRDIEEAVKNER